MDELRVVMYMIKQVEKIEECHKMLRCYYEKELSVLTYGWHNPYAPPELRRNILKGEKIKLEQTYDLHVLMIKCYELIYGRVPMENFQLNRKWTIPLEQKMIGWDEMLKQCIIKLIGRCTLSNPDRRLKNIDELKKQEEYLYITNYAKWHIS